MLCVLLGLLMFCLYKDCSSRDLDPIALLFFYMYVSYFFIYLVLTSPIFTNY